MLFNQVNNWCLPKSHYFHCTMIYERKRKKGKKSKRGSFLIDDYLEANRPVYLTWLWGILVLRTKNQSRVGDKAAASCSIHIFGTVGSTQATKTCARRRGILVSPRLYNYVLCALLDNRRRCYKASALALLPRPLVASDLTLSLSIFCSG